MAMDFAAYASFFAVGSFVAPTERILWITSFYIGIIVSSIGITCIPQTTVVEVTSDCVSGLTEYNQMYLMCFAVAISAILQSLLAICALLIRGSERNINELPTVSRQWCRRLVFTSVAFVAFTSLCVFWITNSVIFLRVAMFHCLGGWRYAIVTLDSIAGIAVLVFCLVSSFISLYGP